RLGDRPRVLLATTPRTTPFMKKLVAMDDVRITSGSTYDNAEHLSADFLRKVRELYEGTRLDRQDTMILDPHRPQGAGAGAETREAGAAPARRQAGRGGIAYPHSGSQG